MTLIQHKLTYTQNVILVEKFFEEYELTKNKFPLWNNKIRDDLKSEPQHQGAAVSKQTLVKLL